MPSRIEKTVFISYRRTNLPWALAIYQNLTSRGYDVFFDYQSINSGDFEQIILANIRARAHFIVLLTPTTLERCQNPRDWLRREIETAIIEKRNIVPLFLEGFDFKNPTISSYLTNTLAKLPSYNGLNVPADYFDEAMTRLQTRFLYVPLDAVLHPLSERVNIAVQNQQKAATKAAKINESELSKSPGVISSYTFFYGNRGSSMWGVPQKLVETVKSVHKQDLEFKAIALGPNSSYAFFYGKNGYSMRDVSKLLIDAVDDAFKQGHEVKSIALGPELSYALFYGNRGSSMWGVSEELINAVNYAYEQQHQFKSIALS